MTPQETDSNLQVAKVEAEVRAKADRLQKDHDLGRVKGQTPEQIAARRRVVEVFREQHLPKETPVEAEAFMARVDYTQPLVSTNALGIDVANPKGKGFLGMGRRPAYLLSKQFPPHGQGDPIYALEYYPVQK